jgi:hypothetical protein
VDRTRRERRGLVKAVQIAAAEDFGVGHELVAAHLRVGIVVGILVDELDHHVVVRAGGGGKDVGDHFAGEHVRSFLSTGSFHTATSLRPVTKRWSSVSQLYHCEPSL